MRFREQNIRAPEENARTAGYCESGLQSPQINLLFSS